MPQKAHTQLSCVTLGMGRTVDEGWNGSLVVGVGEENQLFIDEVIVGQVPSCGAIQVLLQHTKRLPLLERRYYA